MLLQLENLRVLSTENPDRTPQNCPGDPDLLHSLKALVYTTRRSLPLNSAVCASSFSRVGHFLQLPDFESL